MRKGIANDPLRKHKIAQAVLDLLAEEGVRGATDRELRLHREMYAYGSTSPRVREQVRSFEARAIAALTRHFSKPTARALDALVEGWWIYQSWPPGPLDRDVVTRAVDALADAFAADRATTK